jgi:hypothetical protein
VYTSPKLQADGWFRICIHYQGSTFFEFLVQSLLLSDLHTSTDFASNRSTHTEH